MQKKARITNEQAQSAVSLLVWDMKDLERDIQTLWATLKDFDRSHRVERGDDTGTADLLKQMREGTDLVRQSIRETFDHMSSTLSAVREDLGVKRARALWAISQAVTDPTHDETLQYGGLWRINTDRLRILGMNLTRDLKRLGNVIAVLEDYLQDEIDHVDDTVLQAEISPLLSRCQDKLARVMDTFDALETEIGADSDRPKTYLFE